QQDAIGRNPINSVGRIVDEFAIPRLAISDLLFGTFALGDIEDAAANQLSRRRRQPHEINLARDIRTHRVSMHPFETGTFVRGSTVCPNLTRHYGMASIGLK